MINFQKNNEPEIPADLAAIQNTPERDPLKVSRGRLAFLQESQKLGRAAVSPARESCHYWWIREIRSINLFPKKEHSPMFTAIATFLVITSLVLGGTGVTAAAAQSSLPNDPLYKIKLLTEDLRLALANDPRVDFDLTQQFLDERIGEIETIVQEGEPIPEGAETELQAEIDEALKLALNLPADQADQALAQMRTRLETHMQALTRLEELGNEHAFATVFRTRVMMLAKMKLVDEELSSQGKSKGKPEDQTPIETIEPTDLPQDGIAPVVGNGQGQGNCSTCTPAGDKQTGKPDPDATKAPGSNNGKSPNSPVGNNIGQNSNHGNGKGGGKK
jgi:hypothetical protein